METCFCGAPCAANETECGVCDAQRRFNDAAARGESVALSCGPRRVSVASPTADESAHDTAGLRAALDDTRAKLAIVERERDTYRAVVENVAEWLDGHATTEEIRNVLAEHRRGWRT